MKRMILCVAIMVTVSTVNAQLHKGQWIVGGTGNYSSSNTTQGFTGGEIKVKTSSLEASPGGGYFFMDRLAGGVRLLLNRTESTTTGNAAFPFNYDLYYKSTQNAIGGAPFVRYYFLPEVKKVNILAEASYSYSRAKTKEIRTEVIQNGGGGQPQITQSQTSQKLTLNTYSIEAGPAFFLTRNASLEVTVGYAYSEASKSKSKTNSFMVGFGFQIHLGK